MMGAEYYLEKLEVAENRLAELKKRKWPNRIVSFLSYLLGILVIIGAVVTVYLVYNSGERKSSIFWHFVGSFLISLWFYCLGIAVLAGIADGILDVFKTLEIVKYYREREKLQKQIAESREGLERENKYRQWELKEEQRKLKESELEKELIGPYINPEIEIKTTTEILPISQSPNPTIISTADKKSPEAETKKLPSKVEPEFKKTIDVPIKKDTQDTTIVKRIDKYDINNGKSFTEIFQPKENTPINTVSFPKSSILPKQDHQQVQEKKMQVGLAGEKIALAFEERKLTKLGYDVSRIKHLSLTNDAAGYDILSLDANGKEICIEVKATTQGLKSPFYLSELEMHLFKTQENYLIYRVHSVNVETEKGSLYIIDKNVSLDNYFNITPNQFKFSPKK